MAVYSLRRSGAATRMQKRNCPKYMLYAGSLFELHTCMDLCAFLLSSSIGFIWKCVCVCCVFPRNRVAGLSCQVPYDMIYPMLRKQHVRDSSLARV